MHSLALLGGGSHCSFVSLCYASCPGVFDNNINIVTITSPYLGPSMLKSTQTNAIVREKPPRTQTRSDPNRIFRDKRENKQYPNFHCQVHKHKHTHTRKHTHCSNVHFQTHSHQANIILNAFVLGPTTAQNSWSKLVALLSPTVAVACSRRDNSKEGGNETGCSTVTSVTP